MSTIAIGDIHGNLAALDHLLAQVQSAVAPGDTIVFLGDYIDRGPDVKGCVDAILRFRGAVAASVVCLRGNHEDWMLRTAQDYTSHSWLLGMEGLTTIESYSTEAARVLREAAADAGLRLYLERCPLPYEVFFDALPAPHRKFFDSLELWHQTPDCLCVHAGVNPSVQNLAEHAPRDFVWGHDRFPAHYRGADIIVYGHKSCKDVDEHGWPALHVTGRTFGIDTIAQGVLTALRLPGNHVLRSGGHP